MDNMYETKEMDLLAIKFPLAEVALASAKLGTMFEVTLEKVAPTIVLYALTFGEHGAELESYARHVLGELQKRVETVNRDSYIDVVDVMSMVAILNYVQIAMIAGLINSNRDDMYVGCIFRKICRFDASEWKRIYNTSIIPKDIKEIINYGVDIAKSIRDEIDDAELGL